MMMLDTYCSMITKAWRRGNEPIIIIDLIRKYENKEIDTVIFQEALNFLGNKFYVSSGAVLIEVYALHPLIPKPDLVRSLGAQQDEINAKGELNFHGLGTGRFGVNDPNISNGPKEITAQGGKQTLINVRWDLLDPYAMNELVKLLYVGAEEYGENNWRQIPVQSHVNHAMAHLMNAIQILAVNLPDSKKEAGEELTHAFCRGMFALGTL